MGKGYDAAEYRILDDLENLEATAQTWTVLAKLREMEPTEEAQQLALWLGALHREVCRQAEEIDALRATLGAP